MQTQKIRFSFSVPFSDFWLTEFWLPLMLHVSKKWGEYFDNINNEKRSSSCWRSCISTHTWMDERKLLDPNSFVKESWQLNVQRYIIIYLSRIPCQFIFYFIIHHMQCCVIKQQLHITIADEIFLCTLLAEICIAQFTFSLTYK